MGYESTNRQWKQFSQDIPHRKECKGCNILQAMSKSTGYGKHTLAMSEHLTTIPSETSYTKAQPKPWKRGRNG